MKLEEYGKHNIEESILRAKIFLETGKGFNILEIEESSSLKNAIAYVMSKQWRTPIFQENFIDLFIKLRRKTATEILSMCHEILSSNIGLSEGEKNTWCDKVIKTVKTQTPKRSEEYINDLTTSIMDVLSQEIEELYFEEEDFFDDFSSPDNEIKDINNLPSKNDIINKKESVITINPSAIANDFLSGKNVPFKMFKEKMSENDKFSLAFINALNNKQLVNEINGDRKTREKFLNALYWLNDDIFEKSWNIFIDRAESFLPEKIKKDRFKIIWLKIIRETKVFTTNQKNIAIKILKKDIDFSQFRKNDNVKVNKSINTSYKEDVEHYFKTGMYTENILQNSNDEKEKIQMGEALANKYANDIKLADSKERPNNYKPDPQMELFCDFLVLLEYEALSYTLRRFLDIYFDLKEESLLSSTKRKLLFFLINKLRTQLSDEPDKLKKYQNQIIEIISGITPNQES